LHRYRGFPEGRPVFSPPVGVILGGRLYGAKISVEYYLYLFPYTVRPTLYRVWKLFRYLCPRSRLYCASLWHTM